MVQNYLSLIDRLRELKSETEYVEFKLNFSDPEREAKDICALANAAAYHGVTAAYKIWGIDDKTHKVAGTSFSYRKKKKGNQGLEIWLHQHLSDNANFEFHEETYQGLPIVILKIWPALHYPVRFDNVAYIRTDSSTQVLKTGSTREAELWKRIQQENFENQVSIENLNADEVTELLDCKNYFSLLGIPIPNDVNAILHYFKEEGFIVEQDDGFYSITNLGAILFANDLSRFPTVWRKSVRIIQYAGLGRSAERSEREFNRGYALDIENIYAQISAALPSWENVHGIKRVLISSFPEISIREIVINALIHQDLGVSGAGPMVEIFDGRLEVTNPGLPLVDIERIVNDPPQSRNEKLSALMRRFRFCEEAGSGWDKVIEGCEHFHLPAPRIDVSSGQNTRVVLFAAKPYKELTPQERLSACYWHACISYERGIYMTNASLRERFDVAPSNAAQISRLIKEAVAQGFIKPVDATTSPRYMRYMPAWA